MHPRCSSVSSSWRRTRSVFGALAISALLVVGAFPVGTASAVAISTTTTVLEVSASTLQTHHPITLTATVTPDTPPPPDLSGSVTFHDLLGTDDSELGTVAVVAGEAQLVVGSLAIGTHTLTAEYAGDVNYEDSISNDVVVVVTADLVEASGVGVSAGKFFPKVDGYKDTLKIKGTRLEPLTVAIVIRNSAGKKVRAKSIALAAGTYSWAWNGKNAAGRLQPAGTYTIRQTLRDAFGTKKVVKSTVKLSLKKLVWRTHTASKALSQRSWLESGGGAAGWAFTVPRATVYGKLAASVYAKGKGLITMRLASCGGPTWSYSSCWDAAYKYFSGTTYAWRSLSKASSAKFITRTRLVRVVVAAGRPFAMGKVRITLRYAVLR